MKYGYTYVWPRGERPYFVLPNGQVVVLEVCHNIPYLKPGNPLCRPRKRRIRRVPKKVDVGLIDAWVDLAGSSTSGESEPDAAP
eukprot:10057210-Lingulodinium_polyedra.AAC.1